jgi:serine/threonine protein phosphatase PrpC
LGIYSRLEVDTRTIDLVPGDRLMLCTDGLWNMVFDFRIAHILSSTPTSQTAVDTLIATALDHGGEDNIAVVVCDVQQV